MAKKIDGFIKLQIPAGKATPAPPVGPALGQKGVNIVQFTKEFNAKTADKGDTIIPVIITVYADKSFSFVLNLRNEFFAARVIRTGRKSLVNAVALCENKDADGFAGAVRKNDGAAHLLFCMTSVTARADMQFNSLIKFSRCCLLYKRDGIICIIKYCTVYKLCSLLILFSSLHVKPPCGILGIVPPTIVSKLTLPP